MPRTELDVWNRALRLLGDYRLTIPTSRTVTAATAANPVVCTSAAHGYANDDLVLLSDLDQMTPVNGRIFQVANAAANTFELRDEDGSGYTAETGGGRAWKILPVAKHVLNAYDAWPDVRDEVLRRHPWNCATKSTRLARLAASKTITGATQANPVVITAVAHGYASGDQALLENLGGMVELHGRYVTVGVLTANTFSVGIDGTTYAAYTTGGTAKKVLTPLPNDFGLGYRYALPSDSLRVLELVDSRADWEVRDDGFVATDDGPTVPIRYVRRVTDPTKWDRLLVQALSTRLACDLVESITGKSTLRETLRRDYERILLDAASADGQEGSASDPREDDWVLARESDGL